MYRIKLPALQRAVVTSSTISPRPIHATCIRKFSTKTSHGGWALLELLEEDFVGRTLYRESIFNTQFFQVTTRQYITRLYGGFSNITSKQKGYLVSLYSSFVLLNFENNTGSFGRIIGKNFEQCSKG